MTQLFINLSNHPSSRWSNKQVNACGGAKIIDMQFPAVDPQATSAQVKALSMKYLLDIKSLIADNNSNKDNTIIMVQGEFNFVFDIVVSLLDAGYTVVSACSARNTVENPDGSKTVKFDFVQFRNY